MRSFRQGVKLSAMMHCDSDFHTSDRPSLRLHTQEISYTITLRRFDCSTVVHHLSPPDMYYRPAIICFTSIIDKHR